MKRARGYRAVQRIGIEASGGWKSSEARFEEVILGPELLHPLIEEIHLGGQGASAGYLGSPVVVGEADPAGNKE